MLIDVVRASLRVSISPIWAWCVLARLTGWAAYLRICGPRWMAWPCYFSINLESIPGVGAMRGILVLAFVGILSSGARGEDQVGVVESVPTRHFRGSPQNSFPVSKIHVKVGDIVKFGDVLIELDPAPLPVQISQAQFEAAKVALKIAENDCGINERKYKRAQALAETSKRFVAAEEMDIFKINAESSQLACEKAEADLTAANLQYRMAKYNFDTYSHMRSWVNGVVTTINVGLGQVAWPQNSEIVWVEVVDLSVVQVHLSVSVKHLDKLRSLIDTAVTVDRGKVSAEGMVQAVGRSVNAKDEVQVILQVPNPDYKLLINMKVRVHLPLE